MIVSSTVHEITAGHRSLSGMISCVTGRIRFLPVTMTGRFSNFNSTSYTEDRHELRVTGSKCRLLDTMSSQALDYRQAVLISWLHETLRTYMYFFQSFKKMALLYQKQHSFLVWVHMWCFTLVLCVHFQFNHFKHLEYVSFC